MSEEEANRVFQSDYVVRFGEIDHAGVMYYPALFDRMHRAFEDFWSECRGRTYSEVLDQDGVGFPVIDIHTTFKRPFRFGETLRARIDVLRIGRRSVTFRHRLSTAGDDRIRAVADVVCGVIKMPDFAPADLPEEYRQALRPYLVPTEAASGG